MARYRKWDLRTWSDKKFRELTPLPPSGQSLWMYLILGPQTTNIPGLFEGSEVAMADRLGWSLEDFRKAFREASSKGMAKADWTARLVWLPNSPKYNKPESPNVVISWGAVFDELPECDLKARAYQSLKAFAKGWGESYAEAFHKAFAEPSGKPMPNQEQEQEQEHEQEQDQEQELGNTHTREASGGKDVSRGTRKQTPAEKVDNAASDYENFLRVQRAYPKFAGRQDWIQAQNYCLNRIEEGESWDSLVAAAERYAKYIRAKGDEETQFVLTPAKFFSAADQPWKQPWTVPKARGNGSSNGAAAASSAGRRTTEELENEIIVNAIREGRTDAEIVALEDLAVAPNLAERVRRAREGASP